MKKINFIIISITTILSFSCKKRELVNNSDLVVSKKVIEELKYEGNLHKVIKIDSIDSVYTIYSQSKGKKYKILTSKTDGLLDCEIIRENKIYDFELEPVFKEDDIYMTELDGILYNGVDIYLDDDPNQELYYANNLVGLCFIK